MGNNLTKKITLLLLVCLCLFTACLRVAPEPVIEETSPLPTTSLEPLLAPTVAPEITAKENGTLEGFEPATLKGIIQEFKEEVGQVSLGNLSLYPYPSYQVRLKYEGDCRDIPPGRLQLMAMWAGQLVPQKAEELLALYEMECRFSEDGEAYWMPIQTIVLQALKTEVENGEEIDLFIRWIGVNREKVKIDWVFWIIDFLEV